VLLLNRRHLNRHQPDIPHQRDNRRQRDLHHLLVRNKFKSQLQTNPLGGEVEVRVQDQMKCPVQRRLHQCGGRAGRLAQGQGPVRRRSHQCGGRAGRLAQGQGPVRRRSHQCGGRAGHLAQGLAQGLAQKLHRENHQSHHHQRLHRGVQQQRRLK
jgi:hypothetical protein